MKNSKCFGRLFALLLGIFAAVSLRAEYEIFDMDALPTANTPPNHIPYTASSGSHAHRRGPKTMMFVYVKPSDGNEPAQKSFSQLESELNNTSQFYYDESYRSTWFGPKVMNAETAEEVTIPRLVVVRIDLPSTVQNYRDSFWRLYNDVVTGVRALGGEYAPGGRLDPANFDRIQAQGDPKLISSSGLAYVGGVFSYSGNNLAGSAVRHELGHNWGVYHANYWKGSNGIPRNASGTHSEYGDGADIMGSDGSGPFNAMFKSRLGFLDVTRGEVLQVDASGTYRLFSHTNPESRLETTKVRTLNLPVTAFSGYPNKYMYLGFRYKDTTPGLNSRDSWDTHAVQLHAGGTSPTGTQNNGSHFLDTTPNSIEGDDRIDGAIKIGRTYSEGPDVNGTHIYGGVHITPVSKGELTANSFTHHYMDVVVNYGGFTGNASPTASFSQTMLAANVGEPLSLTVQAQDADGDGLAYDWDFGDGGYSIENTASLQHAWTGGGLYLLRCTVSDMKGGSATAEAWVNVGDVAFQTPDPPAADLPGLAYRYVEGSWYQLPDFEKRLPAKTGTVSGVTLSPRERDVRFGMEFDGYIDIPESDVYTFHLTGNDGVNLWIGETLLIDHDGIQSVTGEVAGNLPLSAGKHRIRLEYFNQTGTPALSLQWSRLSSAKAPIPVDNLSQLDWGANQPPVVSITAPTDGTGVDHGQSLTLAVNASDSDGIDRVQYFEGTALLGESVASPFSFVWQNAWAGDKEIRAVAYDQTGRFAVSTPVAFSVDNPDASAVISLNLSDNVPEGLLSADEVAGAVYAVPNWTNVSGQKHITTTVDAMPDHTGQATTASALVEFSHQNSQVTTYADASTSNGKLMFGGLHSRDATAPRKVTFSNIPYATYDVIVYVDYRADYNQDAQTGEYRLGGSSRFVRNVTQANTGLGDYPEYPGWSGFQEATAETSGAGGNLGNYVVFRNQSQPGFVLEVVESYRAVNGIQIVDTDGTPPPVTAPQVTLGSPNNVGTDQATVHADLTAGTDPVSVQLGWGLTDGGNQVSAWDQQVDLGVNGIGSLSHPLTGLSPDTMYFYRFFATNSGGSGQTSTGTVDTLTETQTVSPVITLNVPTVSQVRIPEGVLLLVETEIGEDGAASGNLTAAWEVVQAAGTVTWDASGDAEHVAFAFSAQGNYTLRLVADNGSAQDQLELAVEVVDPAEANAPPQALPAGWNSVDIGNPTPAGGAERVDGDWIVEGAGGDIHGGGDQFHYAWREVTGDVTLTTRASFDANPGGNAWSKIGLMLREELTAGSRNVFVLDGFGTNHNRFQHRSTTNGSTTVTGSGDMSWLRLKREGDLFTGYVSDDGAVWTQIGSVTLTLPDTLYAGLGVTSHSDGTLTTARFENFEMETSSLNVGPWVDAGDSAEWINGDLILLSGDMSDDALPSVPGTVSLLWKQVSGPQTLLLDTPATLSSGFTPSVTGTYLMRLTAFDGEVKTGHDVSVVVWPAQALEAENQWMQTYGLTEDQILSFNGKTYRADTLFIMGVNPLGDGTDLLQGNLVFPSTGGMKLRFNLRAAREYQLEASDSLTVPDWKPVGSPIRFSSSQVLELDLPEPPSSKFYRIQVRYPEAEE